MGWRWLEGVEKLIVECLGHQCGAPLRALGRGGGGGEVTFSLRRRSRRSLLPFSPSRPQAIPAAADFLLVLFLL